MINIEETTAVHDIDSVTVYSVDLPLSLEVNTSSIPTLIPIDSGAQVSTMPFIHPRMTNKRSSDQMLSFGNHSTAKVECIGNLGELRDIMVNKDTKPLISMAKLCKENKIPIIVTADKMYLMKPKTRPRIAESDILMFAELSDGLYKVNFSELMEKVGKVSE